MREKQKLMNKLPKEARKILNFPGYYITKNGKIWSEPKKGVHKRGMFLKPQILNHGQVFVDLYKNNLRYHRSISRLVLETFIGLCPKGMECCHYNDIPNDNRLENLRWDTRSENAKDSFKNGKQDNKGENHSQAKLNNLQVRIIRRLLEFGTLKQKEISQFFNVLPSTISRIKHRVRWQHI